MAGESAPERRNVSRSMVALLVSVLAVLVLAVMTYGPELAARDDHLIGVPPGLLTVDPSAQGVATLGGGVTASMYPSGLRLQREDDILMESVVRGSIVSAVLGEVSGEGARRQEHVTAALDHVHITALNLLPSRAAYEGTVSDGARQTLPLTLTVEVAGPVLRVTARVRGASAVVFHLDSRPLTVGIAPVLPAQNLRRRSWWLAPSAEVAPAYTTILRTVVSIGPRRVDRGVDLRFAGRHDVHVWADTAVLTVTSRPGPAPSPPGD